MGIHKLSSTPTNQVQRDSAEKAPSESGSSNSDEEEDDDDENWDDWVSDSQSLKRCLSLFDETDFKTPSSALAYDKERYGFDLEAVCRSLALDFYSRTRLVNYIRKEKPRPSALAGLTGNEKFFSSDLYLVPTIEDDPLLQVGADNWSDDDDDNGQPEQPSDGPGPSTNDRRIRILERKLAQAKQDLLDYRKLVESRFDFSRLSEEVDDSDVPSTTKEPSPRDDDSHYFRSYGENDIHAVMIQDKVRTATYASFILSNSSLFQGAVVMDVGCGTGILSLFAARAGAKRVFAVDASDVAEKAEQIVKENSLEDIITVIRGKVEEIELPDGVEHVDIIISEWMGYALLYESMLDSVLRARDRFLRPGGVMVPSQCRMMLGLCQAADIFKERIAFWNDIYGFDLSSMARDLYDDSIVDVVGPDSMVSDAVVIKDLHLQSITPRQLDFSAPFALQSTAARRTTVHALLLYFDTFFTTSGAPVPPATDVRVVREGDAVLAEVWRVGGEQKRRSASLGSELAPQHRRSVSRSGSSGVKGRERETTASFSTGPHSVPTHWKQTLFLLREPIVVEEGTVVSGTFHCRKSEENSRELDVELHYSVQSPDGAVCAETIVQTFKVR